MKQAKLIIGIGNPDEEYQNTRHNIGFMFLDYLAKEVKANNFELDKKSESLVSKTKLEKTSLILAKPQTYVNKSGEAVSKLSKIFKVKPENIIIIQDDLDIPFGNTKMSFEKNSGGHRGIESIMKSLKTKKFYRLRIGLATKSLQRARQESDKKRDEFIRKFVLSKFSPAEQGQLKKIFEDVNRKLIQIR